MTDKTKEILSALIDGEASEIEIHRLLRHMGEDELLVDSWVSFQETRRVLRSPAGKRAESAVILSSYQHRALNRRISAAIQEDTSLGEASDNSGGAASYAKAATASYSRAAAVFALAASLVAAVFIGIQLNGPEGSDIAGESTLVDTQIAQENAAQTSIAQTSVAQTKQAPALLSDDVARGGKPDAADMELRELDEEGQRRLRTYLSQHDRMARLRPNTSLVTYKNQPKK